MESAGRQPVRVSGVEALRGYARFLRDPIEAIMAALPAYGPFAVIDSPLRIGGMRKLTMLAFGPAYNREVLGDPATWRTIHIMAVDRRNTAARRVGIGIISMSGARHAHYRHLLTPPLRRPRVDALGDEMAQLVEEAIARWPVGSQIDLWSLVRALMQAMAITLLFGGDLERGCPIADLVDKRARFSWSPRSALMPYNLPFTPYGRMRRQSEDLERKVLDWADCKRIRRDDRDLLSILVHSPDEDGNPPSAEVLAGHVPTLFLAAYDTCQSALIWTLVLLAQHPRIANQLVDELRGRLGGAAPTLSRVSDLPLLDSVVKESMRILPPVPMQARAAHGPTSLAGFAVPARTRVLLSGLLTNRMPELYPEGASFKPERWAKIDPSAFEYSAFSAGPRSCPGFWFGLSLQKVILAAILVRYRIALRPGTRIDYRVQVTMAPRAPVPAQLHPQDNGFARVPLSGKICSLVRFGD